MKWLLCVLVTLPIVAQEPMDRVIEGTNLSQRVGEDEGFLVYRVPVVGFEVEISLDESDFSAQDAKDLTKGLQYMQKQIENVRSAIPAHAFNKLRNRILIEYEDRRIGVPTYYGGREPAIELWNLAYHLDILDGDGGEYGNDNIMLHELAHAWHDQFIEGGFENEEIKTAFEDAKTRYATEDATGDPYYWATSHREFFAEFSVMYFRSTWDLPAFKFLMDKKDRELVRKLWNVGSDDYLQ